LWEALLPEELLVLPAELTRVDALLDDRLFLVPFGGFFDPRIGRPSTAMETYLRLMFLKFRYRLGYESLCREVADSITWRRFTRIGLAGRVPDPTTLMKLTKRFGRGGHKMYALSQGVFGGGPPGAPALPNTGALVKVNRDGTFAVVVAGLNLPSSLEFIGNTAYVVTLAGEVWKIANVSVPPHRG
jgi:hypothetical protein